MVENESFSNSFLSFTEMTQQLQAAYKELEDRYETLNRKLQETNIELRQSLGEKERLSSYLNNILENLNSGVIVIDIEGRVKLFNRAAERILKFPASRIINKKYSDFFDIAEQIRGCLETLESGRVFTEEEKVVTNADGSLFNIGFSTSLLRAPDGEIIGAVEVFYDLTKLKKLEREMARVSTLAALGRMAATIAHEIRNPLGGISGFAALLSKDIDDDDPRKRLVSKITKGVSNLNRIVNGLLDFTREPKLEPIPTSFPELIDEVVDNIAHESQYSDIVIERDIDEAVEKQEVDRDSFKQILSNLINNAMQASANGGKVRIVLKQSDSRVRLEIIDTGIGITEDNINRIFDPFFTTRERGTGLGLAIVKKLVNAQGGSIFAESGGSNKGARFVISLPKG
ncbi:MAG: PAS domain S-box protein [candidate division Zixibacteria bacterium]|nr:PAS domain S-box protein [candidate division Zixibacteria bacterium]